MGRRTRQAPAPTDPRAAADAILGDPLVRWIPVRHHSPACALHVEQVLREERPAAVLIEGPEDLQPLVPWLAHPGTAPPLVALVAYTDTTAEPPVRSRTSWPVLASDPEWVALRVGSELGADVRLIDAPVRAVHDVGAADDVPEGRAASEARFFHAVARRAGSPDFAAFWEERFESSGMDALPFFRGLLACAWAARALGEGSLGASTTLREAHMRWHVDQALAAFPGQRIAVVTGAYHTVVLPTLAAKRAKAKADKAAGVVLSAASYRVLSRLGVRYPAWTDARYAAMREGQRPIDAATDMLVQIARAARALDGAVGTADAIGAVLMAAGLADRFGRPGALTAEHVLDAVRAAFVKGALDEKTDPVMAAADRVLVGSARGRVPDEAGRPPLVEDFWGEVRAHRLDLGDDVREVRCDVDRQEKHRAKSAFLHRCELLQIPIFGDLPDADVHFRGPDPIERSDLHLLIERWGVMRGDDLDDTLLELSDRGDTVVDAAAAAVTERRAAGAGDAAQAGRTLLLATVCRIVKLLPELLVELRLALGSDGAFVNLVEALQELAVLRRYPDLPAEEVGELVASAFERACLVLPASARVDDEGAPAVVEQLVALSRFAAEDRALDRRLLGERLWQVAQDTSAQPLVRGACWGLCSAFGVTTPRSMGAELQKLLRGPLAEVRKGGSFLEGVLRTSRSSFLTSPRLLDAVHDVLVRLPEEEFLVVLPDFRRAFSVFVPAELERIGEHVLERMAGRADAESPLSPAAAQIAREVDERVRGRLAPSAR
jgi:Family of unknown function (DUF5682)